MIEELQDQLKNYTPELTKLVDFDLFWEQTKQELKGIPLNIRCDLSAYPSSEIEVYNISCQSLFNETLRGWYILPKQRKQKIPCVIEYRGFMSRVGQPMQYLNWVTMGYAVLVLDIRGQGGQTSDTHPYPAPYLPHLLTHGLLDQTIYYQRRLFADALRAVDVAEALTDIDNRYIVLSGISQGGALAMAAASLAGERIFMTFADVPSSSDVFQRIKEEKGSFSGIADYLRLYPDDLEQVMNVQTYFDTMNMAEWIKCPVVASVAGKDQVCPAKNYFATYNRIKSQKELFIYPYNGHEGGGETHILKKMHILFERISYHVKK